MDKITLERETLERLLADYDSAAGNDGTLFSWNRACNSILDALRAALAAQPSEPVADRSDAYDTIDRYLRNNLDDSDYAEFSAALETLYAAPAAVPLTDEQIEDALLQYRCEYFQDDDGGLPLADALAHAFGDTDIARAKHEIKMIVDALAAAGDKT